METAPPIINENKMNFKVSEIFDINDIKLTISYNDDIILFKAEEKEANVFPKKEFSLIQSLKDLLDIDRYFRQFDNLKEVFDSIKILINNKNISIIKKEKEVSIKMKNLNTNKEFFINLKLKEKDFQTEMKDIIPYISSLNNKITNLENQIKEMKNDFNNKLKSELDSYKKQIEEYIDKNYIKKGKLKFNGSKIIQENENELISKWFGYKNPISAKLLLDAKIDDNFYQTFFEKCGNVPNTMIFIKTTEGERFGGYTSVIWPNDGKSKDTESFLFSLSKKEKYKVINPDYAIGVSKNSWISFGCGNDLWIYNDSNSRGGGTSKSYYDISGGSYSLNRGKSNFNLLNCEIYQIEF